MGHTLLGPDHYVPFIAMARARGWGVRRTMGITAACGVGHLAASLALGAVGIAAGLAISDLERLQAGRGRLAGWLLIGFGLAYLGWGLKRAVGRRPHSHWHAHGDGTLHRHQHVHAGAHLHAHTGADSDVGASDRGVPDRAPDREAPEGAIPDSEAPGLEAPGSGAPASGVPASGVLALGGPDSGRSASATRAVTPWVLFTIFLFGPCEPLIPLLMYPAATGSWLQVGLVVGVFALATLTAMLGAVAFGLVGMRKFHFARLERYGDALAGAAVTVCGIAVTFGL